MACSFGIFWYWVLDGIITALWTAGDLPSVPAATPALIPETLPATAPVLIPETVPATALVLIPEPVPATALVLIPEPLPELPPTGGHAPTQDKWWFSVGLCVVAAVAVAALLYFCFSGPKGSGESSRFNKPVKGDTNLNQQSKENKSSWGFGGVSTNRLSVGFDDPAWLSWMKSPRGFNGAK